MRSSAYRIVEIGSASSLPALKRPWDRRALVNAKRVPSSAARKSELGDADGRCSPEITPPSAIGDAASMRATQCPLRATSRSRRSDRDIGAGRCHRRRACAARTNTRLAANSRWIARTRLSTGRNARRRDPSSGSAIPPSMTRSFRDRAGAEGRLRFSPSRLAPARLHHGDEIVRTRRACSRLESGRASASGA